MLYDMAMQFIFGLGNPGEEYSTSRHNIGFQILDMLHDKLAFPEWRSDKKFNAHVSQKQDIFLVKPQTYMNTSGQSVQRVLQYYDKQHALGSDELDHVFVVYDDLDLSLGQYKFQMGIHPKIHNGVNSVIQTLHTDRFWNVRIGTDARAGDRSIPPEKYVLMPFNTQEQGVLAQVLRNVVQDLYAKIVPPQPSL